MSTLSLYRYTTNADQEVARTGNDAGHLMRIHHPTHQKGSPVTTPENQPQPTPVNSTITSREKNTVGLVALILGIVAMLFAVVPFLSFIAWLPALAAIILGIVGLVLKNKKRALAAVGLVLGVLAIIVGIIVTIASLAAVGNSISDSIEEEEQTASEIVDLVYEVTSDSPTAANVTYSTYTDEEEGTQQATDPALPFSTTLEVERGGTFDFNIFSLTAQASQDATTITCKITLDGQVISENTSTGSFAVASCTGSSSDLDD